MKWLKNAFANWPYIFQWQVSGCTSRDLSGIYESSGLLPQGASAVHAALHQAALGAQFQQIATVLPTNFFPVIPGHLFASQGPTLQQHQQAAQQLAAAAAHHQHQAQQQQAHQQQQLSALQGASVNNPSGLVHHQQIAIPTIITTAHVDNKQGKNVCLSHKPHCIIHLPKKIVWKYIQRSDNDDD